MHSCVCRCKYQLIVVGGREIGVPVGNQEQLAIGMDGEEAQELVLPAPYKIGDGLGLGLGHRPGPTVDF